VARSGRRGLRRSLPLFAPKRAPRFQPPYAGIHSPHAGTLAPLDRGADEAYLAVAQEEAEKADKDPVNADLLTMLVLAISSFFGLIFGFVLANTQKQEALCSSGVVGPSLASACEELPFLGVFRL
jgi:hypothetical protein